MDTARAERLISELIISNRNLSDMLVEVNKENARLREKIAQHSAPPTTKSPNPHDWWKKEILHPQIVLSDPPPGTIYVGDPPGSGPEYLRNCISTTSGCSVKSGGMTYEKA